MICYQGSGFESLEKSGVLLIMLGKYFSRCSSIAIFPYALGFLFSKIVYSLKKELLHILISYASWHKKDLIVLKQFFEVLHRNSRCCNDNSSHCVIISCTCMVTD